MTVSSVPSGYVTGNAAPTSHPPLLCGLGVDGELVRAQPGDVALDVAQVVDVGELGEADGVHRPGVALDGDGAPLDAGDGADLVAPVEGVDQVEVEAGEAEAGGDDLDVALEVLVDGGVDRPAERLGEHGDEGDQGDREHQGGGGAGRALRVAPGVVPPEQAGHAEEPSGGTRWTPVRGGTM